MRVDVFLTVPEKDWTEHASRAFSAAHRMADFRKRGNLVEASVGTTAACDALRMPRPSYYWHRGAASSPAVTASRPRSALRPVERETVLACLYEERFQDRSPAAVYATLLDEEQYIAIPAKACSR